ncbi:MAG: hypothetical protein RLY61_812 [Candidatus Parcubacteria bacterium]|jgi:hypothetical protein
MAQLNTPYTLESEFQPLVELAPIILQPGEGAWMLTNPATLPEEFEGVRNLVVEANTNAGGVAVLPFESSREAILA